MKPLLTALCVLLVGVCLAQKSDLDKSIQLQKGWIRIDAIMQAIYEQGGLKFSFNSQQIDPSKKIHIARERLSVGAVLSQVEQTANVKFKVVGRHIILLNQQQGQKPKSVAANKNSRLKSGTHVGTGEKQSEAPGTNKPQALRVHKKLTPLNPANRPAEVNKTNNNVVETLLVSKRVDSLKDNTITQIPGLNWVPVVDTTPTIIQPPTVAFSKEVNTEKEKLFWVSAGVYGSEFSYVNPSVRAGYKRLYGILSLEFCACSPHYRWGLGLEQWADRRWQLHHNLTTATAAALYPEGTIQEVLVKDRHFKWSVLLSKRIFNKVYVQLGPAINALHTRYFSTDAEGLQQKIAAGTLLPETMDGDKVFSSTESPYTLFNTYKKERVANWKGWIGAELSVYYRINFSFKK